jgi:tetratricopeptide (TPR) repeat protein
MDVETALEFLAFLLQENKDRPFNTNETAVLRGSWDNLTYQQIADKEKINFEYLKQDVGYKLWKKLSKLLLQKVTKKNCKAVIELAYQKYQKQLQNSVSNNENTQIPSQDINTVPLVTPIVIPNCINQQNPQDTEKTELIILTSQVINQEEEITQLINTYQCVILFVRILVRLLSGRTLDANLPEKLNDLAVDYQGRDQLFIANILYHLTIICNPDYPVHYALGSLYEKQNLLPQAREAYMMAISQKRPRAYNNLARLYIDDGQYETAIELLQDALTLAVNHNEEYIYIYYKNLGRAYMCLDKYEQATEFLEKAIKLCPNLPAPYGFLAIVKEREGKQQKRQELWQKFKELSQDNHNPDVFFLTQYYSLNFSNDDC